MMVLVLTAKERREYYVIARRLCPEARSAWDIVTVTAHKAKPTKQSRKINWIAALPLVARDDGF